MLGDILKHLCLQQMAVLKRDNVFFFFFLCSRDFCQNFANEGPLQILIMNELAIVFACKGMVIVSNALSVQLTRFFRFW